MAHNQLGQAYLQQHLYEPAIAELQKTVQLSAGSPTCVVNLTDAYALSGQRDTASKLLDGLETSATRGYSYASEIAAIYVSLRDTNEAMNWLEKVTQNASTRGF